MPGFIRAIGAAQRHPILSLVVGVLVEVVVVALIGNINPVSEVRGIGGESAALLAVVGALLAGPLTGGAMAVAGWCVFFPTIADDHPSSLIALPVWTIVAFFVGATSRALIQAERSRTQAERDVVAAHELRTPVATIHGLVVSLEDARVPQEPVLRAIRAETSRLLESELFDKRPVPKS
jgi:signal transduction histidine kinase